MDPHAARLHTPSPQEIADLGGSRRDLPTVAMPRIELPAGVTADVAVQPVDRELAGVAHDWTAVTALIQARGQLRQARRLKRQADRRGAGSGREVRRRVRELALARERLLAAGVLCGVCQTLGAGLTVHAEQVARVRGRCEQRLAEDQAMFAVTVENWLHDIANEPRLTRG